MYFFVTSQRSRDPGRPHSRLPPLHHQSFHPSHRLIRLRDGPSHPHTRAGLRPVCVPPLAGNVRQTSTIFSCQLWSHDPRVKEDQIVADEVGPWCRRYLNVQRRVQSVCHSDQTAEVRKTNVESVSLQCPLLSLMTFVSALCTTSRKLLPPFAREWGNLWASSKCNCHTVNKADDLNRQKAFLWSV